MKVAALGAAFVTTALALLPFASAAHAEAPSAPPASDAEAISLLYEDSPPADCPSQADFEAEVGRLTSKAHFTQQHRARRIRIELGTTGRDVFGRLISGDGKNQSSREVRGKDCKAVASALAIAVALTIDPEALLGGPTEPEPQPPEPPPEPAKPAPPPAKKPPPPKPRIARPLPPPPAPTKLVWGLGASLTLESAWSPQMRPGGGIVIVLGVGDRVRASVGGKRFLTRQDDEATFGAWMADGSVSYNLALLGVLRPFAMLGYEFGAVDAAGTAFPANLQAQRPWQAASGGLGLRFETNSVFLQLGGSLLVPISRQRYLVSDPTGKVRTLYEVPGFGLRQETSLGVFL